MAWRDELQDYVWSSTPKSTYTTDTTFVFFTTCSCCSTWIPTGTATGNRQERMEWCREQSIRAQLELSCLHGRRHPPAQTEPRTCVAPRLLSKRKSAKATRNWRRC